jgi:hypothetical protein
VAALVQTVFPLRYHFGGMGEPGLAKGAWLPKDLEKSENSPTPNVTSSHGRSALEPLIDI